MRPPRRERRLNETREAAGNGLLDRRAFLAESAGAVTAHLLSLNGIIGEQDVMSADSLPKVKMPNRDNFILVYPWKPRVP
jgi:hypothetical protein